MSSFGFLGKINKKIRELRRSDQKTKRYWLIGSTAAAMIIIIILWVGYLNITVPKVVQNEDVSEIPAETEENSNNSIFSILNRGFKATARSTSDTFGKFSQKITELISKTKNRLENVKEYTPPSN